ncbi:MAG: hypothetical protein IT546_07070 [Caulobacteraceae bacterium]|nr:hypothetical protein [Caulobacteraceae bacterium]
MRLFHVSEEPGIAVFHPRPSPAPQDSGVHGDCVWAIDEPHLVNFMTPRDCPRITFGRADHTTAEDAKRFLHGARRVVAFEKEWLERLQACTLHIYELPTAAFELALPEAGYWIARGSVEPVGVRVVTDVMGELVAQGAEVRILQDFWPLCDQVAASTLEFSISRKRNALPRRAP